MRESILAAIKQNQPSQHVEIGQYEFESNYPNLLEKFEEILNFIGGKMVKIKQLSEIENHITSLYGSISNVASSISELSNITDFSINSSDPHDLETIQLAIVPGGIAVAENAAIWLTEADVVHRALPFICQYLAIVIHAKNIVGNMHQAYARIQTNATGWGCFVAGPSKTADIEQSLIIGAHGARGLVVLVIED
jgi:L-lactate dehydrogenase complex protein LldG